MPGFVAFTCSGLKVLTVAFFGIGGGLQPGEPADFTLFDLTHEYTIRSADFLSMGKATPFEGWTVKGRCMLTLKDGKVVYRADIR